MRHPEGTGPADSYNIQEATILYNMNKLLSATQLAEYLNLKPVTIRRKAKSGGIPSIKIGNRLRFDKQQIDKWLLERTQGVKKDDSLPK